MKYNLSDRVYRELTAFAKKHDVQKIILFGSRARGTHTERSDIDLAVYGGDFDRFSLDVKEGVYSLLTFDLVNMDSNKSEKLQKEIEKDGVVLYEKDR